MVNGESEPDSQQMGISSTLWMVLMFTSAIFAFCSLAPPNRREVSRSTQRVYRGLTVLVRVAGMAGLIWAAFVYRSANGTRIISLAPFAIHTDWYGILGLIGWSYLMASLVFLTFRANRAAILGCIGLMICLFAADRKGLFENFWLNKIVGIGETLGSHPAIATAGVLLGTLLLTPDTATVAAQPVHDAFHRRLRGGCVVTYAAVGH